MIEVTWKDYPHTPYPPFKDPEDWRELASPLDQPKNEIRRARQLVEDADLSHYGKHRTHDHPWCSACEKRRYDFEGEVEGVEPLKHPHEVVRDLRDVAGPELWKQVQTVVGRVKQLHRDGFGGPLTDDERQKLAADLGLSEQLIIQAHTAVDRIERWEYEQTRVEDVVMSRVGRYLLVHRGTIPVDTYDPDAETEDDDDDYLDRDQLRDLPVPEPLIDRILTRHTYALLVGRDHTFKTFVALDWALCLATDKPWQGQAVESGRVLYVVGEGAYGINKRVDAWEYAWGRKVDAVRFTVKTSAVNLYRGGPALERLLARISEGAYDLVVIDTLRRSSGGADGNSSDMGVVVDNLERIKRATDGGTVLVIAHTDKGDNDARGFSGIEDDADIVWHAKADELNLTLTNTKQKDQAEHAPIQLHMKAIEAHDSLVIESATVADIVGTESEAKILVTMREMFSETGATSTELLEATGLTKSTYYRARNRVLGNGLITNTGTKSRPRYELAESLEVPTTQPPLDLHLSHESQQVPSAPRDSPTSPAPLIGRDVGIGTGNLSIVGSPRSAS